MKRVLVWGIGKLTKKYIDLYYFKKVHVIGYVESNPQKREFNGLPVYSPKETEDIDYDYIFVCVLENCEEIYATCDFYNISHKKVIYASWKAYKYFTEEMKKNIASIELLETLFPEINKNMNIRSGNIMREHNISVGNSFNDYAQISKNEIYTIAWVPIELLFTEKFDKEEKEVNNYTEEWRIKNIVYQDIPIISLKPHKSLYDFLLRGVDNPCQYINWYKETYSTRNLAPEFLDEELLAKRYSEVIAMQMELNKGMDFFIDNPVEGRWNERGYFNLQDGHHRAIFLYQCGLRTIPVKMTNTDYDKWKNEKKAQEVFDEIKKQKREEFYQPIANPYFMDIFAYRDCNVKSRVHHFYEFFSKKSINGKTVIDIGANLGYIGQAFYRMGADVTMIDIDDNHFRLLNKINSLMHVDCKTMKIPFEQYSGEEKVDIGIMLTVFYHYFRQDGNAKQLFIDKLNECINEMLIWESGDSIDEEKKYLINNLKFNKYEKICYTYGTGKIRELGVFFD